MGTRILGAIGLLAFLFLAQAASAIEAPFNYEPVGPRAWPLVLCTLGAIFSAAMALRGDARPSEWPTGVLLVKSLVVAGALMGLALLFGVLGYPIAAALASIAFGLTFGASLRNSAIAGVAVGALGWVLFDKLLDVALPLGLLAPLF